LKRTKRKIKSVNKGIYKKPWFVYIIECSDKTFYVGIARDVEKRIKGHNTTTWCRYTRSRKPVKLVYQEKHPNHESAIKREIKIKTFPRKKKLTLTGLHKL